MNYKPLPTDTEDMEIVEQAERVVKVLNRISSSNLLSYIKDIIASKNAMTNEYNELVEHSKQKQLELVEKYSTLAEKYFLLSDKYSNLIDKHIALKEQHDPI